MVDPAHAGRGVGRALAVHVIDLARDAGYRAMQFNAVVETNHVAVHLWQSLGFEILATIPESFDHPAHGLVGMHVMHRRSNGWMARSPGRRNPPTNQTESQARRSRFAAR